MSNNQIIGGKLIKVEEMTVKPLRRMLTNKFGVKRLSALRKAELIRVAKHLYVEEVHVIKEVNVYGVEVVRYEPKLNEVKINKDNKKIRTTKEAFNILSKYPEGNDVVADVSAVMATGVKLRDICESPEEYIDLKYAPYMKDFVSNFNPIHVSIPTREMGLVWVSELNTATVQVVNGSKEVVIKPRLELRAQNHMMDRLARKYVFITRNEQTGEIEVVNKHKAKELQLEGKDVKRVRDMRYIVSMDYNLPILRGENALTKDQIWLQTRAITGGVWFEFNGHMLNAEYFLASASEKRTVMGTHIVGMDAVEALHFLGMDFRQFAKFKNGKYVLDMIKAPNRFGLASTSSVPSSLIKIGNKIKEYENGNFAIVGGTHTMLCAKDIYAYVREGEYLVYNPETNSFELLDASELPYKRNVTDGLIFADASIQFAINAEFGKLISAEQVRITPATKGLVVFVPGLKDMVGHDLLAFESATKGDYKTLLRTNPDFEIEFRIAIFGKNASEDKKKTNIPYQMIQTVFGHEHLDDLRKKLDAELDEAFEVYDSPERLSEYLGTKTLEIFEGMNDDELTEEQRELIDDTLVSMFTNFFYVGDFIMEDPYFKKRLLDIIENMIRAWTRGAMPIEGHYRYMVTDVYGVMEAFRRGYKDLQLRRMDSDFLDENGDIIVPSHVGIPANRVVMIDDEDKYFVDGKDIIFQRNPKISNKETAKAKGIIIKDYFYAREAYKFALNNLVFFSCHDFNVVKQGGADFDGDTCHTSMDPVLIDAYKERPALLDYTKIYNKETGKYDYIEGCPFQPKTKAEFDFFGAKYRSDVIIDGIPFNDEFKVTFTDEDYDMDFARKVHELSKVFVLRSLEPNQIGQLTNYATQILSAISRLEWSLHNNVDVNSKSMTEETRKNYLDEIQRMETMVDLLRLLQGWEIDKPKHGGAFWNELKEQLRFITDSDYYPTYATDTYVTQNGKEITRYAVLEWHRAVKTRNSLEVQDAKVFPSLMQELRSHVLLGFATKIKARFMQLNPSQDTNNLITRLAPVANVNDHGIVEAVLKMLSPIFREYGQAQLEIMNARQRFEEQRSHMKFASRHEAEIYDRRMNHHINTLMDKAISNAQAKVKALPFDEASIAYIAYAKKYREYRPNKAVSPASGLSFPWVVCRDGMLELVSRVSGKSTQHVTFDPIQPASVTIRFKSFEMAPEKVANLFANAKNAGIVYDFDEVTGNYLPFVFVGGYRVAILVEDSTYYFTGGERFIFTFNNFELSKTGKSASVVLDNVVRYQG